MISAEWSGDLWLPWTAKNNARIYVQGKENTFAIVMTDWMTFHIQKNKHEVSTVLELCNKNLFISHHNLSKSNDYKYGV